MAFSKIEFDWQFNVFVDNDSISEERNKASILIGHAHNRAILLIDTMQTSYQFPTCIVQQQCNQYMWHWKNCVSKLNNNRKSSIKSSGAYSKLDFFCEALNHAVLVMLHDGFIIIAYLSVPNRGRSLFEVGAYFIKEIMRQIFKYSHFDLDNITFDKKKGQIYV